MDDTKLVLEFCKKQPLAVVSTISKNGDPEAAVVGFCVTDSLEFIFDTSNQSRKYANIRDNQKIAAVIGWDKGCTVQYEGVAREITEKMEWEECWKIQIAKEPAAAKYKDLPESRMFKVAPRWVRYTDLSVHPWKIIELKF